MKKNSPMLYRKYWTVDLLWIIFFLIVATVPFLVSNLDIIVVRQFYIPNGATLVDRWILGTLPPWQQINDYSTIPAVIVTCIALAVWVASYVRSYLSGLRIASVFLLLTMLIGPLLVVNGILKTGYGRPRPVMTVEFGGDRKFRPVLEKGIAGKGASFPSGHCSTGFFFVTFYFLLRRRHPLAAVITLACTMAYGAIIGLSRIVAGSHYPSDVMWSGGIVFLVAYVLYYFVLNIPAEEDARTQSLQGQA